MIFRFGDFELDSELYELRRGGERMAVEARVLDFLIHLVRHRDRVVPKEELLAAVWPGVTVGEQSISQALYTARRLLGDDSRGQRFLQTVRRRGVRFVAPVEERTRRYRPPGSGAGPPGVPPFVGRVEILQELAEALDVACEARGQVVLISGEPGIGKSRLLEEFAERIKSRGIEARFGRCREDEGAPAFWPWVQVLRAEFGHSTDAERGELGRAAPHLVDLFPELAAHVEPDAPPPTTEPAAARFRLFDAVTRFLLTAAARSPCVVLIDDLHRADDLSWRMLLYLAREIRDARLLLLATYRDAPIQVDPRRRALLAELAREPVSRLEGLGPLTKDDLAALIESIQGETPSAQILVDLRARSGGNPFFAVHLARLLRSSSAAGSIERQDQSPLPRTLREALMRQMDGLPEDSRLLLASASVLGRDFLVADLAAMVDVSPDRVIAALDPIVGAGLATSSTREGVRFSFAHVLLRDALYEALPSATRVSLHAKAAEVLEERSVTDGERLGELAHHLAEAASIVGDARAVEFARRAGRAAADALAFDEAASHFRRALGLISVAGQQVAGECELLLELGAALVRSGDTAAARPVFVKAASLVGNSGETEKLARVALAIAPGFLSIQTGVTDPFIVDLLERSLNSLPSSQAALRARLMARLAVALYWEDAADARRELIETALREAEMPATSDLAEYLVAAQCVALWSPHNLEKRVQALGRLIPSARRLMDRELLLMGRVFRIATLLETGDLPAVEGEVRRLRLEIRASGLRHALWYEHLYTGMLALERGRLAEAKECAERIAEIGTKSGDSNVKHSVSAIAAVVAWHRGEGRFLVPAVERLAEDDPAVPAWRCAQALFLCDAGRLGEARGVYESLVARGLSGVREDMNWLFCLGLLTEVCVTLGDSEGAHLLKERIAPFGDRFLVAGYGVTRWGSVPRSVGLLNGLLGRLEEGIAALRAARQLELQAGGTIWLGYVECELAALLCRRGRSREAAEATRLAENAASRARENGISRLGGLAETVLTRAQTLRG